MTNWNRMRNGLAVWLAVIGMACVLPGVVAQDQAAPDAGEKKAADEPVPAEGAAGEPESKADSDDDSIMQMVLNSGATGLAFMCVLVLFSLAGATVALERAVNTKRSRVAPASFMTGLQSLLGRAESTAEEFRDLCEKTPSPVARILQAGLLRCGRPITEVEKTMEDAAAREMADIRGRIKPLSVVGSIAPLVGLLGTVLGMIIAFRTASQEGLGRGELMAQGIYMALLTTAAGLSIAIPCLLLAAFFNARVEKFFRDVDVSLMEAMPRFAFFQQAPMKFASKPAAAASTPDPVKQNPIGESATTEEPAPAVASGGSSENPLMSDNPLMQ